MGVDQSKKRLGLKTAGVEKGMFQSEILSVGSRLVWNVIHLHPLARGGRGGENLRLSIPQGAE